MYGSRAIMVRSLWIHDDALSKIDNFEHSIASCFVEHDIAAFQITMNNVQIMLMPKHKSDVNWTFDV